MNGQLIIIGLSGETYACLVLAELIQINANIAISFPFYVRIYV